VKNNFAARGRTEPKSEFRKNVQK